MAPKLYYLPASPPVRAVLMAIKVLNLDVELVEVNLLKYEHLASEFLKINPHHTVPTLVEEDGFTLWDSHAILTYLASKYSKDDSLYPKNLKLRAIVDQRLHFDNGVAFARLLQIVRPIVFLDKKALTDTDRKVVDEVYELIEVILQDKQWIAGDTVTIADFSLISTISSLNGILPIDIEKFPKLVNWLRNSEGLPAYEANKVGLEGFISLVKSKIS